MLRIPPMPCGLHSAGHKTFDLPMDGTSEKNVQAPYETWSGRRLPSVHHGTISLILRNGSLVCPTALKCPRPSVQQRALHCGITPPRPRSPRWRRGQDWRIRSSGLCLSLSYEIHELSDLPCGEAVGLAQYSRGLNTCGLHK